MKTQKGSPIWNQRHGHTAVSKIRLVHILSLSLLQLHSLLLKAQYQPVVQNILLWLPSAVSAQERRWTAMKNTTTTTKNISPPNWKLKIHSTRVSLTSLPILSISPGTQVFPAGTDNRWWIRKNTRTWKGDVVQILINLDCICRFASPSNLLWGGAVCFMYITGQHHSFI